MTPDNIMHAYVFHSYARRNPQVDFVPSLICYPMNGAAASEAYYKRVELSSRRITAMAKTNFLTDTQSPLIAIRMDGGSYYIPKDELEEIAAEHHDDDIFEMINSLFRSRKY